MRTSLAFILLSFRVLGQDPRGTIAGRITDSSGSVIPGATVTATNLETNVGSRATSNSEGNYEIPYLLPGHYRLTAEQPGFKTWTRVDVELRMRDRLLVDIQLEVGPVTEVVEVAARAQVLETTTGGMGQVLDSRQISNLPLRSGSISWLFSMTPGVVWQRLPYDGPWNIADSSALSVAGAGSSSMDFNLDGVSNNSYGGQTAFVPPAEMVAELRLDTMNYDASVGHTTGGAVNITLKSGTNGLHGSLGMEVSSGPMQTRNFFTDQFIFDPTTGPITPEKIKANTPTSRWLRTSAVAGGPVYIPRIYNGRNKTFFMFGYQRHNRRRFAAGFYTVPTAAEREGDFSALLAIGPQYQVYDPFTTAPSGASRFSRQPLAGNRVPASRMDPIARKLISYYPAPNTAGTRDFLNNYNAGHNDTQDLSQPMVRIDHNFSEKNRFFGRYSETDFTGHFDKLVPNSDVRGRRRQRPSRGIALDDVMVLSANTVLDLRYGFTWFREWQSFDNIGWNLSEFGFPPALVSQFAPAGISFPELAVDKFLQLGNDGGFVQTNYSHSLLGVLTWTKGNHSIKAGFDGRLLYENYKAYGNVSPHLDFQSAYTNGPLDNAPAAPVGQGFASFLFGIPSGGYVDLNDSFADRSRFYAPFLQDDWRISRKLTLNLGLRWEHESPPVERFNRTARQFDFQSVNPTQAQAQAQYAKSPVAQIPDSQFRTLGGLTFAGAGGNARTVRDSYGRAFMPRFGFAYQLTPRVVMRGGYGIFFGLLGVEYSNAVQPGFNQRTNVIPSLDTGVSYVASISNPLPNGLQRPAGAAGGLTTFLGRSPGFFATDGRRPYTQRWSYSIQVQPVSRTVVEAGYMGTKSVHQRVNTQFNAVPRPYLSTSPVRDQPVIDLLSSRVANPFAGIAGFAGSNLYSTVNTTLSQLVRPFPEFTDLSTELPAGFSWYHALTLRAERRFAQGIQLQGNYTFSKTMDALSYRNATDSALEHVISSLDRPHRLAATIIWELPFGRGRRFGSSVPGVLNHIAGGWAIDAIYQFQSGPPLAFGNVIFRGTYDQLRLGKRSLQRWFNTDLFERNSNLQLANNLRTFPVRVAAVRSDGMNIVDVGVHKEFGLYERIKMELRGTAEGIMNHPNFAAPNADPSSSLFGRVNTTQTNQEERRVFVGLKLIF